MPYLFTSLGSAPAASSILVIFTRPFLAQQGFPQDKIIAGRSIIIGGHIVMTGSIFSIF